MVVEVKNEDGVVLGYIIEEDNEGDNPMEEDSREVVKAIIEEEKQRTAENVSLHWPEVR